MRGATTPRSGGGVKNPNRCSGKEKEKIEKRNPRNNSKH